MITALEDGNYPHKSSKYFNLGYGLSNDLKFPVSLRM